MSHAPEPPTLPQPATAPPDEQMPPPSEGDDDEPDPTVVYTGNLLYAATPDQPAVPFEDLRQDVDDRIQISPGTIRWPFGGPFNSSVRRQVDAAVSSLTVQLHRHLGYWGAGPAPRVFFPPIGRRARFVYISFPRTLFDQAQTAGLRFNRKSLTLFLRGLPMPPQLLPVSMVGLPDTSDVEPAANTLRSKRIGGHDVLPPIAKKVRTPPPHLFPAPQLCQQTRTTRSLRLPQNHPCRLPLPLLSVLPRALPRAVARARAPLRPQPLALPKRMPPQAARMLPETNAPTRCSARAMRALPLGPRQRRRNRSARRDPFQIPQRRHLPLRPLRLEGRERLRSGVPLLSALLLLTYNCRSLDLRKEEIFGNTSGPFPDADIICLQEGFVRPTIAFDQEEDLRRLLGRRYQNGLRAFLTKDCGIVIRRPDWIVQAVHQDERHVHAHFLLPQPLVHELPSSATVHVWSIHGPFSRDWWLSNGPGFLSLADFDTNVFLCVGADWNAVPSRILDDTVVTTDTWSATEPGLNRLNLIDGYRQLHSSGLEYTQFMVTQGKSSGRVV